MDQKRLNLEILVANLINQTVKPIQISRIRGNWTDFYHWATFQTIDNFLSIKHPIFTIFFVQIIVGYGIICYTSGS